MRKSCSFQINILQSLRIPYQASFRAHIPACNPSSRPSSGPSICRQRTTSTGSPSAAQPVIARVTAPPSGPSICRQRTTARFPLCCSASHPPSNGSPSGPSICRQRTTSTGSSFCSSRVIPRVMAPPPAPQSVVNEPQAPVPPSAAQPVIPRLPVPPFTLPSFNRVTVPPQAPQPVIIEPQIMVPPSAGSTEEHKSSQIDKIIHSIEPLIEDSVPRNQQSAPVIQKNDYQQKAEPDFPEHQATAPSQVLWPVLPNAESPVVSTPEAIAVESDSPPPHLAPEHPGRKPNYLTIAILIIAILPIIAGPVIVANIMSGPTGGPANTIPVTTVPTKIPTTPPQSSRTPVVTSTITPGPTQVMIPPNGVWVRALYPGTYIGLIGHLGTNLKYPVLETSFIQYQRVTELLRPPSRKRMVPGIKSFLRFIKTV